MTSATGVGQANALTNLGSIRRLTGDYPGAARDLEEALGICRDIGDRVGQADALTNLGAACGGLTGDYPGAARDLEEALGIYRDIGDQGGEVEALNEAGTLHRVCGDLRQAGSCHQQALDLARQIGSSWDEAHALAGLGRCALAAGRHRRGRRQAAAGAGDLPADRGGRSRRRCRRNQSYYRFTIARARIIAANEAYSALRPVSQDSILAACLRETWPVSRKDLLPHTILKKRAHRHVSYHGIQPRRGNRSLRTD